MQPSDRPINRLANAQSPYLLQHQHNPVDWYEWGDEAFEKARAEDKPIFLSIGYSTCHWCHVMERESFEDDEVAALMNQHFVSVKVDREERPDIDRVYMTFCQMSGGNCGWPLNLLLTHDKQPFFVATYIPKHSGNGRPGMLDLITGIGKYWRERRDEVLSNAEKAAGILSTVAALKPSDEVSPEAVSSAFVQLRDSFDAEFGGFGGRPKFPAPHNLQFLLRYWKRMDESMARDMVLKTLREMRKGGIFDHVGFGFHRYSTDARWFMPHFEKMLYDQAMMLFAYTEAYQATGKELYAQTAREIIAYVLRDMADEGGGFYSAEDADSEGEEGKFYVWRPEELFESLGEADAAFASAVFNITKDGTYHEEATGEPTGASIPFLLKESDELATALGMSKAEFQSRLEKVRGKMFDARERRIRPGLDDKVLTDWNGLMIAALAAAGRALNEPDYIAAAERAADFILDVMRMGDGRLLHRYRGEEAGIDAFADDYAFMLWGLIELHQATQKNSYLAEAVGLAETFLADFWDSESGAFFHTAEGGEIIVRSKECYDSAIPSANSAAMLNLIRLARLTGRTEFEEKATAIGKLFSAPAGQSPTAFTAMLNAVQFGLGPAHEIVIVGDPTASDTLEMLAALRKEYLPHAVVLVKATHDDSLDELAPYTRDMKMLDDRATAYVCREFACSAPTNDVEEMLGLLKAVN